jgi:transposase
MAEPVKVRRLTDEEGRKLQRLVRRGESQGKASVVRYRRALVVLASAGGNTVPVIARLVQTSPDRVREVIHNFNKMGMACLDPKWAGGRPRRISPDDEAYIVETATTRPEKLGAPFTHWSLRKLRVHLVEHGLEIGRERLRQILDRPGVTFQRTKTWKESNDPERDVKLDRNEQVIRDHPDRCFAFDEFGPLAIHPIGGCCWAKRKKPERHRANYHKTCGVRQLHACYSVGDDTIWGVVRERKSVKNSLAAIKSCRQRRRDGERIYVILDNLSSHKNKKLRAWCERHDVELCLHPHLQLVGEPNRDPLWTAARLCVQQLRPRRPPLSHPADPRLHRLAQPARPGPRGPRLGAQTPSRDARRDATQVGQTGPTGGLIPAKPRARRSTPGSTRPRAGGEAASAATDTVDHPAQPTTPLMTTKRVLAKSRSAQTYVVKALASTDPTNRQSWGGHRRVGARACSIPPTV